MALTIEVTYESAAALAADWQSQLQLGGLFAQVTVPEGLPPFAPLTVVLLVDGAPAICAPGRLTAASADSLCVEIAPDARQALAAAVASVCAELGGGGSLARRAARLFDDAEEANTEKLDAEDPADGGDLQRAPRVGLSLERKLLAMSVSEKVQVALHGTREERALLLRDRAGVVQASLVRNPRISLDELAALARSSLLQPDAAEALAHHPSWGSSPTIATALARNPRTPLRLACGLVDRLPAADLRALAKGVGVRIQVAQAARKRLLE